MDLICAKITPESYLSFEVLSDLVLSVTYDYYHGKPAKVEEGEQYNEWAFAKNLYHITRKLKAMDLEVKSKKGAKKSKLMTFSKDNMTTQMIFDQLKYSYLLHRIIEIQEILSLYMGRWGYSDLWSCLERITSEIEAQHKLLTKKKLNPAKRFRYWMGQLLNQHQELHEDVLKDFLIHFLEDYETLWAEELKRVYQ